MNVAKPPTPNYGWSKDSTAVLITDGWEIWRGKLADGGGAG